MIDNRISSFNKALLTTSVFNAIYFFLLQNDEYVLKNFTIFKAI
ncbi:hypothetical protein RCH18_002840 [Flavobacterium sp. PL11]|nr:hypothetical protein [Flavobacterium sp. PL11]